MYAILDIRGGNSMKRLKPIAIYKFDGHEIVDQFMEFSQSIPIQPLADLINNAMLTSAALKFEVAKRIIKLQMVAVAMPTLTIDSNEFAQLYGMGLIPSYTVLYA
jgi:predicted transcriptional regulator